MVAAAPLQTSDTAKSTTAKKRHELRLVSDPKEEPRTNSPTHTALGDELNETDLTTDSETTDAAEQVDFSELTDDSNSAGNTPHSKQQTTAPEKRSIEPGAEEPQTPDAANHDDVADNDAPVDITAPSDVPPRAVDTKPKRNAVAADRAAKKKQLAQERKSKAQRTAAAKSTRKKNAANRGEVEELYGIHWQPSVESASTAAQGVVSDERDKPIFCLRVLGDLSGFM
jgi:hypothetical protein